MEKDIYRKKSIERVSSPEQLNSYIKVCTPTLWVVLSAVILLLCGVIVWSIFGKLDTTIKTVAVVENGKMTVYFKTEDIESVKGKVITINQTDYLVSENDYTTEPVKNTLTEYALDIGNLKEGEYVFSATTDTQLKDGVYQAEIITDSVSPISFIIN